MHTDREATTKHTKDTKGIDVPRHNFTSSRRVRLSWL